MSTINLFELSAKTAAEQFETLLATPDTRIERIVSWGQASAPDFWYDQSEGEWVAVLSGQARLRLRTPDEVRTLGIGDWLWIAPHRAHRVEWTAPGIATVWLAVFVTRA